MGEMENGEKLDLWYLVRKMGCIDEQTQPGIMGGSYIYIYIYIFIYL